MHYKSRFLNFLERNEIYVTNLWAITEALAMALKVKTFKAENYEKDKQD